MIKTKILKLALLIGLMLAALAKGETGISEASQPGENQTEPLVLVRCEYSQFGGMEDSFRSYVLDTDTETGELTIVMYNNETAVTYPASADALTEMAKLMAAFRPEDWTELPEAEEYAMDAPVERLMLTASDGTEYVLSDGREGAGEILRLARCFLESYTF